MHYNAWRPNETVVDDDRATTATHFELVKHSASEEDCLRRWWKCTASTQDGRRRRSGDDSYTRWGINTHRVQTRRSLTMIKWQQLRKISYQTATRLDEKVVDNDQVTTIMHVEASSRTAFGRNGCRRHALTHIIRIYHKIKLYITMWNYALPNHAIPCQNRCTV